ncbi:endonuclease/exonuclease/phosphatase family protein [Candidatus Saccharibacteria bacterium]|nr:endonuclease/exonuclease/phosphatase family protein [Candidatus Saccharibacteria bacterium]
MKIISLNLAGRSNFGKDYNARIQNIIDFIDRENADVVCMQEVTTNEYASLAERINDGLKDPYPFVSAHMSEKYTFDKFTERFLKKWEEGLIEHHDDYSNDGMAILSREPITRDTSIVMKPAPADELGKPDVRVRVSQIIKLESGISIANVHFATNNNAYQQLQELIEYRKTDVIVGDFNMFTKDMRDHKDVWSAYYKESTDFKDYISFPDEEATFDHMLLSPDYSFVSVDTFDGLSDHSAVIYTINHN